MNSQTKLVPEALACSIFKAVVPACTLPLFIVETLSGSGINVHSLAGYGRVAIVSPAANAFVVSQFRYPIHILPYFVHLT